MNYLNLIQALYYYADKDFQYVNAPWVVPRVITEITCPPDRECFAVGPRGAPIGDLVGSGEQSFLAMLSGEGGEKQIDLSKNKYMCITPCFRDDVEDKWHSKYFMKLELISRGDPKDLLDAALGFFEIYGKCRVVQKGGNTSIDVGPAWDIEGYHGESDSWIELGSYGKRYHKLVGEWCYGTGCAEPRCGDVFR